MNRDDGKPLKIVTGTPKNAAGSIAGSPLVTVLAEMVRSALAWEAEQGQQTGTPSSSGKENPL